MPKIVIEKGAGRGDTYRVSATDPLRVGRDPRAVDVVLPDQMVSRKHLRIEVGPDGAFYARDEGSRNGLFVNGVRVQEARLQPGDRLRAGECLLSFLGDDERRRSGGLVGRDVNGHRIEERLGRGGMGTVYRAVQLSLDRPVAIKFLSRELTDDPEFVQRFIDEAHAAGRLSHKNIVQVFDTGRWDDYCYYTMEYMPFGSIGDQISGGRKLDFRNVLPMMVDVARGLVYAERHGVVHRDIKPDNLMLGFDGIVKIGDLGIAKTLTDRRTVGQEDGVYGSAHFMAPEQARGHEIDCRVDIYSMGATFYRVLTGRTLFQAQSQQEILLKQVQEPPEPIREVESSIPKPLAEIIDRMLEKDPRERYRSARDFVAELEALALAYKPEQGAE
jgi:serine/threonine-protein kinase